MPEEGTQEPQAAIGPAIPQTTAAVAAGAALFDLTSAIDHFGEPTREAVEYARSLLAALPPAVKEAAREPYGARAIIYCLALGREQKVRAEQLMRLRDDADPDVYAVTRALLPQMDDMETAYRLPLMDIAIPALKQLSLHQYQSFRRNLIALIEMDAHVDLLEWSLQKIVFNHLDAQFLSSPDMKAHGSDPAQLGKEVGLVLSLLAHAGARDESGAKEAFAAAATALGSSRLTLLPEAEIRVADLDLAFGKLEKLQPSAKSQLLKACAASIAHDETASAVEVELLRAFASALDCPIPPRTGWSKDTAGPPT